jgi:hypothetical protein
MLKRTLLTMTALSSLILISPTLQNVAVAGPNNPSIRIAGPQMKMRIDTRRLVTKAAKKPTGNAIAKAGPQPEPPTRPKRTKVTNVAKQDQAQLPRPRPYNEFEENGNGIDSEIDAAEVLPPSLGGAPELEELLDVTGGNMGDIRNTAKLLEDGPGQNALPEIPGANGEFPGGIGGDLPFGGNRVGTMDPFGGRREAFGPGGRNDEFGVDMMSGIPRSPASKAPNPGSEASSGVGWVNDTSNRDSPGTTHWSRRLGGSGWVAGFGRRDNADGSISAGIVISDSHNRSVGSRTIEVSAPDENGKRTVDIEDRDSQGNVVHREESETRSSTGPTPWDQNANGVPDSIERASPPPPPPSDSQPNPADGGPADGICAGWNPLAGCAAPGLKVWDVNSQPGPDPTGEGSGTARSAGASIGPEAVTNTGDGSFTAGGSRGGGGGGHGIDPGCITAGDDCGNGPDGPVASMDGVSATRN